MAVKNFTKLVSAAAVTVVCWAGMATGQSQVAAYTFDDFLDRIAEYATATEDLIIQVGQDFTVTSAVTIPTPADTSLTITIRTLVNIPPPPEELPAFTRATLTRGIAGFLFTVSSGATLILENITIDGDKDGDFADGGNSLVNIRGTLFMEGGTILRNNAVPLRGGAVYVGLGGTFIMNGGEISDNTATVNTSSGGGGVVIARGMFIMNDGIISGNTAGRFGGGVNIGSSGAAFIMNGGIISGNISGQAGGGVMSMNSGADFTMNGGIISGNTSGQNGGGVEASGFTMTGGEISGNTAQGGGGGVYAHGAFTMTAGEISGNTARNGGGVYAINAFTMTGGEISGNTAQGEGGGVYTNRGVSAVSGIPTITGGEISGNTANAGGGVFVAVGTLIMQGGKVSGNTASAGGGVHVSISSTFIMHGGEISGNTAGDEETPGVGGGVHNANRFVLNDGKIINNSASSNGGGVYVGNIITNNSDNIFTMKGGEINGNTANSGNNVYVHNGAFVVVTEVVTDGLYEYDIASVSTAPVVIKWDRPSGDGPFEYAPGTSTDLTVEPAGATAVWETNPSQWNDDFGLVFERIVDNISNTGFVSMDILLLQTAIKVTEREISIDAIEETAVVTQRVALTGELVAGPNPVGRLSGGVNFYWNGRRVNDGVLTVFDASGNVVNRVAIKDINDNNSRRIIGSWNLTDRRGRLVSEGTYLVRGMVTTLDGKRERVSVVIGVR
jgi:hypothetical protein